MPSIFASLIQSDFLGPGDHGNIEAVIQVGNDLWHYFRDANGWRSGQAVRQGDVAFPGALIQSSMGDDHGNFEVVVAVHTGTGVGLRHIVHFNDDVNSPWQASPQPVTAPGDLVAGPASLIQSDFKGGDHGNLELVVPLMGPRGHAELWHFFHDSSNPGAPWGKAQRVTGENDVVTGPGSLIQSDYKGGDHGNFEVVVPLAGPNGHDELWHFFHDNSDVGRPWARGRRVTGPTDVVAGPGIILRSDFGSAEHKNFEVVVPIRTPNGHTELRHFWHGPDAESDWQPGQMITASARGWAAFCTADFGLSRRTFEVLVEECRRPTIVHYWHDNDVAEYPWLRTTPLVDPPEVQPPRLLGEEPIHVLQGTRKIVQLTGEFDREGWGGPAAGSPNLAHNRTESRWGIRGTDLGVSFPHKDRTCFLFGDTWRRPFVEEERDFDAIAFSTDTEPDDGLDLTFNPRPPIVPGISQHGFEVPLDGVSFGGDMFVFFSTDRRKIGAADVMGRSVVAVSHNEGLDFTQLREFSRDKFINVSIEPVAGAEIGLREYRTALLIAGSGRYRSSDVYLAAMPLEEIASGRYVRYYAGQLRDQPVWAGSEAEAVPLFCSGCVGELSLRWNRFVGRWILLYNSDTPNGIVMRSAPKPWGKWSGPVSVFDGGKHGGYGRFMHIAWNAPNSPHDFTHDDMFTEGQWRENEAGGVYGPYQIAPLVRGEPGSWTQLYFTMSTWNPYQVMLMTARLQCGGPELPGTLAPGELHDRIVHPYDPNDPTVVTRPGG